MGNQYQIQNFSSDIIRDIEDICLEIQEEGFTVAQDDFVLREDREKFSKSFFTSFEKYSTLTKYLVLMFEKTNHQSFFLDDVSDTIQRLIDFTTQNGFTKYQVVQQSFNRGDFELLDISHYFDNNNSKKCFPIQVQLYRVRLYIK